jgi:tetratricopeptide (TPR) repeat protein
VTLGASKEPTKIELRGNWVEARTENFVLFSNAPEKLTRDVARQLELFRSLLGRITSHIRLSSPVPTTLLVFDGEKSFSRYKPHEDVRGAFLPYTDGNFAAFIARPYIAPSPRNLGDESHFPYETVFHEYVHYVLRNNFPNVPLWLNEGLAQYYSMFRVEGSSAQFGYPIRIALNNVKYGPWIPLDDLLRTRSAREHDLLIGQFYCHSWFATHYILNGNEKRRTQLEGYLGLIENGIPSDQAFRQAFQTDPGSFTLELRKYLAGNQFYMASAPLDDASKLGEASVSPMAAADVLTHLGLWLAHLGKERHADAEAHFREALQLTPSHAAAQVGLGYVLDRSNRFDEAEGAYVRAIAADSTNVPARFYYGWHSLAAAITAGSTDATARLARNERAREHLARCVELAPSFAEARFGLGLTFLYGAEPSAAGQALLEGAWKEQPSRMDIAYHAIRLSLATGHEDRARELVRVALRRFPGLLLDYVTTPTQWNWYQEIAVPPSAPEEIAPLVLARLTDVADLDMRAGLEKWANSQQPPARGQLPKAQVSPE